MLDALIAAGTDIFRLNFSHGTHESQAATFARVRAAAPRAGREVAILQDLGGPKIRTGPLEGGRPLAVERRRYAARSRPATSSAGRGRRLDARSTGWRASVRPGDRLLLADGSIELRVDGDRRHRDPDDRRRRRRARRAQGHQRAGRRRCRRRRSRRRTSTILKFGLSLGVDMVALSFVQSADRPAAGAAADGRRQRRRRAAGRQARTAAGARTPRRDPRRRATR